MVDTNALLVDYVTNGSESAFREVAARYTDLVYSTAVRLVDGDTHLAEDVVQTVFVDLARKARTLPKDVMLGGWLHRDTCFVAARAMRKERRRRARERQAVEMNALHDHSAANLALLKPVLDEAINQLGSADRTAILLRFFERRDLRSVGVAMGNNEDAAQKRLARALEKLRSLLKRRGVALSAAALGTALTVDAVAAAPVGLAASCSGVALASLAGGAGTTFTLFKLMTMTKLKIGVIGALVVASVTTPLVIQYQAQIKLGDENQALRQQQVQRAAENERLSNLLAQATNARSLSNDQLRELLRLRSEAGLLRRQNADFAQAQSRKTQARPQPAGRTAAQEGASDLAGELRSVGELNNVGLTTPRSAFETWNWARAGHDIKALANTLVLDADAKAKAEAILASLPDTKRAQFGSIEELIAALQVNSTPITAMRVVSEQNLSADDVVLLTQWQLDGGQMRTNSWQFHRYDDGWRQVIRGGLVDKLGAMANNRDFTR